MNTKTKFFRVAQAGATSDGRKISADWINQAAKRYNRDTYTALVNLEHIRGIIPDSPFKSYGDVVALKAEDVDGKRTLFAQINPTPELIALNKAKQKLFTSVELSTDFAGSGEAYLVGLAITDSPASLGTEMLQFAAGQGENSPLAKRKLSPGNLFTAAEEFELSLEAEPSDGLRTIVDKITCLVKSGKAKNDEQYSDVKQVLEAVAESLTHQQAQLNELSGLLEKVSKLETALIQDRDNFAQLKTQLDFTPAGTPRPVATGSRGGVELTDC